MAFPRVAFRMPSPDVLVERSLLDRMFGRRDDEMALEVTVRDVLREVGYMREWTLDELIEGSPDEDGYIYWAIYHTFERRTESMEKDVDEVVAALNLLVCNDRGFHITLFTQEGAISSSEEVDGSSSSSG